MPLTDSDAIYLGTDLIDKVMFKKVQRWPPIVYGPGSVIQKTATLLDSNITSAAFQKLDALPAPPTPGNSGVIVLSVFNAAPASVQTMDFGGSDAYLLHGSVRSNIRTQVWWVPEFGPNPTRHLHVNYSGTVEYKYQTYAGLECTKLADSPLDIAQSLLWYDYLNGGWPLTLTGAAPTTQANELLIAMAICGSGMSDCLIDSPPSGATELFYEVDSNTYQGGAAAYKVLTTIQTPSMAWPKRAGTTADHWDTEFVTLKFA